MKTELQGENYWGEGRKCGKRSEREESEREHILASWEGRERQVERRER